MIANLARLDSSASSSEDVTVVQIEAIDVASCWQLLGPGFAASLERSVAIQRCHLRESGGVEIRADGEVGCYRFDSAARALRFADEVRDVFRTATWPTALDHFDIRIGIDRGALAAADVVGRVVHHGAVMRRVAALVRAATRRQILLTDAVVSSIPANDSELRERCIDCGRRRLDEVGEAVSIWRLPPAGTGVVSPVLLERERRGHLPLAPGRFVGRADECARLAGRLHDDATDGIAITGLAGVGKTRLACEVALRVASCFPGGSWLVDISRCDSTDSIARAVIASVVGVSAVVDDPVQRAKQWLSLREPTLIILDAAETVVADTIALLDAWSIERRRHRFIVTSRAVVQTRDADVDRVARWNHLQLVPFRSAPMPTSFGIGDADECVGDADDANPSLALFVDAVRRRQPSYRAQMHELPMIAALLERLDGLPLAIELAATRFGAGEGESMLAQLQIVDAGTGARSSDPSATFAPRSLSQALELGLEGLSSGVRDVFAQCCALPASFTAERALAAFDVADLDDATELGAMLSILSDSSLLIRESTSAIAPRRYRVPRVLRRLAMSEFSMLDAKAREAIVARHARDLAECLIAWGSERSKRATLSVLDRIAIELEPWFESWSWLAANDAPLWLDATLAARFAIRYRVTAQERCDRWRALAAALEPGDPREAGVANELAYALHGNGELAESAQFIERALAVARSTREAFETALALETRARVERSRGHVDAASLTFQQAAAAFEAVGDDIGRYAAIVDDAGNRRGRAPLEDLLEALNDAEVHAERQRDLRLHTKILNKRALLLFGRGEHDAAAACFAEMERCADRLGERRLCAIARGNSGVLCYDQGQYAAALDHFLAAERTLREVGDRSGVARNLLNRANAQRELGDYEAAFDAYREAERHYRVLEERSKLAMVVANQGILSSRRADHRRGVERLDEAIAMLDQLGIESSVAEFTHHLGQSLYALGEYDRALECFERSGEVMTRLEYREHVARSETHCGRTLLVLERLDAARSRTESGLRHYRELGRSESSDSLLALATLAEVESRLGEDVAADDHRLSALELAKHLDLDVRVADPLLRDALDTLQGSVVVRAGALASRLERQALGGVELIELIGQGGMGAVYRGRQLGIDRDVAVKVLLPGRVDDAARLARFRREARAVGRFDHAGIVQVYDVGEQDKLHYLVMEFVSGTDLMAYCEQQPRGRIASEEARSYLLQIVEALREAERLGVVHRDVKPQNLLRRDDGVIKITDFGVAKLRDDERSLTQTHALVGTPIYMSPEQCSGGVIDARSDIYSLGASFYHLLAGRVPFAGRSIYDLLENKRLEPQLTLPELDGVGDDWRRWISAMTAADPADRPQSFSELAVVLESPPRAAQRKGDV